MQPERIEIKDQWKKHVKQMERLIRKLVKEKGVNTKIFVDSEGRFLGNSTMNKLCAVADFSLWHLPFDDVVVVGGGFVVRLLAGLAGKDGTRLPNAGSINVLGEFGESWRGVFFIGKEWPNVEGDFKHAQPMQMHLRNGYSMYLIVERVASDKYDLAPTSISGTELEDFVVQTASHAIMYFADFCVSPKYFVVEMSPARKKKGKISRMPGKSVYSVIHIKDIRKRYIPQEGGNKVKIGHERRRHMRTYRHSRYVNMRGRTVIIDSTWIGPKTGYSNNRVYKVHTNLV